MKLCVNLVWPSKIICSLILMQNIFKGWQKLCFWWLKTLFWSSGLKTPAFGKHLNLFSCISFMKFLGLSSFYIIFCNFSKKISFPKFRSIKCDFQSIENSKSFKSSFCLTRLVFDRCSTDWTEKFSVFKYLTNLFFHASFVFRIHMHCIVFLYLSCSFAVIFLIIFTHNKHSLC